MHELTIHTRNWYTKREKSLNGFLYEKVEDAVETGRNLLESLVSPWPNVERGCTVQGGDYPGGGLWKQVVREDGTIVFRAEAEVRPFIGRTAPDTAETLDIDWDSL